MAKVTKKTSKKAAPKKAAPKKAAPQKAAPKKAAPKKAAPKKAAPKKAAPKKAAPKKAAPKKAAPKKAAPKKAAPKKAAPKKAAPKKAAPKKAAPKKAAPKKAAPKKAAPKKAAPPRRNGLTRPVSKHGRADDGTAFLPDPVAGRRRRVKDDLAEGLGEGFLAYATSGESGDDARDEPVPEEEGGPFVTTSAEKQYARGTDPSNPADAEREPFPVTHSQRR